MAGGVCLVLLLVGALGGELAQGFRHSRKEGDACIQRDGVPGLCTGLRRCRGAAARIFRSGTTISLCSYGHDGPIICCPSMSSPMRQQTMEPIAADQQSPDSLSVLVPQPAESAKNKCVEYGEYAYVTTELPTLLVVREFVRELKCTIAEELVVGGQKAELYEFPHMAALGYVDQQDKRKVGWKCAGSLISDQFVLTAAHCTSDMEGTSVTLVRLGSLTLDGLHKDSFPQTIPVSERIRHPGYKFPARYHDIALLKLQRPPKLGIDVRPACLYTQPGNPPAHKYAVATGWGITHAHLNETSNVLMKVRLEFFPTEMCEKSYQRDFNLLTEGIVDSTMICAGDRYGEKDTCMGDSGGPLQIRLKTPACMYSIVGVTSFGSTDCISAHQPGVYTRVSHYVPWIQRHVWP